MRLVRPLAIALLAGLSAIALVGIEQTWATVAIAGGVIIVAAVAVVSAVGRVVDDPPPGAAGPRSAPQGRSLIASAAPRRSER